MEKLVEEKLKELGALYDEREETFAALIGEKDPRAKMREAEQRKEERAKWTQTLDFLPGDKLTGTLSQLQGKRTNELVLEARTSSWRYSMTFSCLRLIQSAKNVDWVVVLPVGRS